MLNKVTGDSKSREVKRTRIEFEVDADEDPAVVVESLVSERLNELLVVVMLASLFVCVCLPLSVFPLSMIQPFR